MGVEMSGIWSDLPRPIAFIRLTDAEKPLLADAIDLCYDLDVRPLAQDGTQIRERGMSEALFALDQPAIHEASYILVIRDQTRITPAAGHSLQQVLATACATLAAHRDVVTIGFPCTLNLFPGQSVSPQYSVATHLRWPFVARTRDLWLATLLAREQAPDQVLGAFSYSPVKHIEFRREIATAL
jgi:hypothetical protein